MMQHCTIHSLPLLLMPTPYSQPITTITTMRSGLYSLSVVCICSYRASIWHADAFAPSLSAAWITNIHRPEHDGSSPPRRTIITGDVPASRRRIPNDDINNILYHQHNRQTILYSTTDREIDMDKILADEARRIALAKKKSQSPADLGSTTTNTNSSNNNGNDKEWQFFDTARVHVTAGTGGNGCVAFRREKGEAMGGPNGGRGGCGGSVLFVADESLNTLAGLRHMIHIKAGHGVNGTGKNRDGMFGRDIRVRVPCGTIVRELHTQKVAGELRSHGQELMVARGGRGGRGNAAFMTNRRTAPKLSERGEPGAERWLVRLFWCFRFVCLFVCLLSYGHDSTHHSIFKRSVSLECRTTLGGRRWLSRNAKRRQEHVAKQC